SAEQGAGDAKVRALDPNGAQALRAAKRLRRKELGLGSLGSPTRLLELAEERFGARSLELGYWNESRIERPWADRPGVAHAPARRVAPPPKPARKFTAAAAPTMPS